MTFGGLVHVMVVRQHAESVKGELGSLSGVGTSLHHTALSTALSSALLHCIGQCNVHCNVQCSAHCTAQCIFCVLHYNTKCIIHCTRYSAFFSVLHNAFHHIDTLLALYRTALRRSALPCIALRWTQRPICHSRASMVARAETPLAGW